MLVFWSLLVLLLLTLLGGYGCMLVAMRRMRRINPLDPKTLAAGSWKLYVPEVLAGADWIEAHTSEILELVSFDGLHLKARFCPVENPRGTVLMLHGFRSESCVGFAATAAYYHSLGFQLLLADQRAHGLSEGKYLTYGILERYDCQGWAELCAARFARPIFLAGISMGAATVLMAANLPLPAQVRGVIADCGFTSAWEIIRHVMHVRCHVPAVPFLNLMNLFSRLFAKCSLRGPGPIDCVAASKLPILFLHGTEDLFVPCDMSRRNYAACTGEKQLILVPGAGHGASFFVAPEVCKPAIEAFLNHNI